MVSASRERGMRRVTWLPLVAIPVVAVLLATVATAAPKFPSPGTSSQVSKAVAASTSITTLSKKVAGEVYNSPNDNPAVDYPQTKNGCETLTSCVFGDKKATKKLVIMGDSHAQMWIPSLNRIGLSLKLKVIVLFLARCPAASLDVWLAAYDTPYALCSTMRTSWIAAINKLHPQTVLLSDHTNSVYTAASDGSQLFTSAQWQAGEETTITDLHASKAKIAVLGDFVTFDVAPPQCLASYPTDVQKCASPNPNPDKPNLESAESAAARAEKVLYVDPTKWLCTSTSCSPVIGSYIVYYDAFHLTCTYAAYLSGVLQSALKKVL